jgi:hypothetical protein
MKRLLVYLRARRKAKRAVSGKRITSKKDRKLLKAQSKDKVAQLELNYNEDGDSMGYC